MLWGDCEASYLQIGRLLSTKNCESISRSAPVSISIFFASPVFRKEFFPGPFGSIFVPLEMSLHTYEMTLVTRGSDEKILWLLLPPVLTLHARIAVTDPSLVFFF